MKEIKLTKDKIALLVYTGNDKGRFWVGDKFGCVHHAGKGENR